MNQSQKHEVLHSRIWQEEAEPDNPFATRIARCHGYDVYGEMLGNAGWAEMLYLLFRGEAPSSEAARLLETLAVALANPGPRDPSIHAAMCSGTCGAPAAASLMSALAVGAGQLFGGREILMCVEGWRECGTEMVAWQRHFDNDRQCTTASTWPTPEHPPGHDPHGVQTALIVKQTLDALATVSPGPCLPWLKQHREVLETMAAMPFSLTGIAGAAYADLEFSPEQAEALHLILRLPGAAVHALEQWSFGHKKFPFYSIEFETNRVPDDREVRT